MKNIQLHIERDDIHARMRGLWRTELFRQSHDQGGFVHRIVDRYADLPRFTFEPSDEKQEKAHFSSWWSGLEMREYQNDAIHDLYLLHEIRHSGEMVYIRNMEHSNFLQKLIDNELDASVCSEIRVYFELPGLRQLAFPHEIFADRFLNSPYYQQRFKDDSERLIEELKIHRRNVMVSQNPKDMLEFWIHKFSNQNAAWGGVWAHRFNDVETAMADLRDDCVTMGRKAAMDKYMKWLTSPPVTPEGTDIPFPDEATAFAGVYQLNMKKYAEDFNGLNATLLPPTSKPKLSSAFTAPSY